MKPPIRDRDRHADRRPAFLARNAVKRAFRACRGRRFTEVETTALRPPATTHLHAFEVIAIGADGALAHALSPHLLNSP